MKEDLISVIIPVRNGENYLAEAIEHIRRQGMNTELIVVDDASDDRTGEIARKAGCTVIRHEKCRGQVAAKNTGLRAAKGEFVMFHDHDDLMRDGVMKKLYDSFEDGICAVEAKVQDFLSPEMTAEQKKGCVIQAEPYYGLFTGAILIRRSVFGTLGDFSEHLNTGEIIEWEFRMKQHSFPIKKVDFVATDRRVHLSNYGKTAQKKEYKDYASVLRAKLMAGRK